ncbi:uncharacterized protein PFL1_06435 [Pseudozyma flocculosa PF-1]|uniref:Related to nitrate transporter n=2 Tax=Pseudozyma flocculosa TaxID=84751 RepID=A0A5C3ETU6_9BASI|nr:uncharacterized protein PFL1_06435 [Pseudozyma flocculosa PF-1]EPQ25980.1 hypothetical protein PFL1_06435 [Pseudozyma flocculosa PF-1]SPO35718.1 related to nitrate transporter [Pseudozyma flocculosa]
MSASTPPSKRTPSSEDEKYDLEIAEAIRNAPTTAGNGGGADAHPGMASMLRIGTNTGGVVTSEDYITDEEREIKEMHAHGYHKFKWSSLWSRAEVNPLNGKSFTFPLLRFWDPYSTAFWLATLGFFVAFFSWFAFSPLVPEAVRDDLKLTSDQIVNSNMASLGGTAIVRLVAGPACDRYGPRKVLAVLLILGAIPSGLAALVTNISGLEAVRFFISILGGTFVPTQAWTTTFFDKSIVGTANSFSGGWGNLGGGVTVAVMIGLYERYKKAGYSSHLAWRLCFPTVPVPCLLLVAAMILLLGKDHPAGKWSRRHLFSGTAIAVAQGEKVTLDQAEVMAQQQATRDNEKGGAIAPAKTADFRPAANEAGDQPVATIDTAQSEPLTAKSLGRILLDLRVWMCFSCYLLTFGLETAMDAALPGLLTTLFKSSTFTVTDAAFAASTYGLLNLFARPLGGIVSDLLYARYGLRAKVLLLLAAAFSQGVSMIGLGFYVNNGGASVGGVIGFIVLIGVTGFVANGACYSVYGHLRPKNVGAVAGIVGAGGNVGGLMYTGIFKALAGSKPAGNLGTKFWVAGVVNAAAVLPFFFVPLGDAV